MSLDPTLKTALEADVTALMAAVEIDHPLGTLRLLDGAGFMIIGGHTFVGDDDNIGSLGAVDVSADSFDNQAPSVSIGILPKDIAIAGTYAIPSAQGSVTRVLVGAYDPTTGLCVGTPDVRFYGEVDTIDVDRAGAAGGNTGLTFTVISGFEKFFETDDGARLADSFQKSVWPGDDGLQYMTAVIDQISWGVAGPKPSISYAS